MGQFNSDLRADLAAANHRSDNVSILLGNGSGGFSGPTDIAAGDYPISVAVGDFNGDARSDLATSNANSFNVSILLGDGSGGFTGPTHFATGSTPRTVAVGDFDGDSRLDLTTANEQVDSVSILLGNGSGGFTSPTNFVAGDGPYSVAVGYFNGDSRLDLVTANKDSDNVSILLNTTGYVRPKTASPVRVSLVPAHNECTSPNRVHGPPDFPGNGSDPDGSCNPPSPSSAHLTAGNPNANFTGLVKLRTVVGAPGGVDDSDVAIDVNVTDVRCQAGTSTCGSTNAVGGDDYTGEVQLRIELRITDRYNGSTAAGGSDQATGDKTLEVTVPCGVSSTPNTVGSSCALDDHGRRRLRRPQHRQGRNTNGLGIGQAAGVRRRSGRRRWTPTGNTLFAKQGLFVP